jgi:hypothetical protein
MKESEREKQRPTTGPDEHTLLIAFARAASKAQEIESLLQESLIGVEVATDTRGRSFEQIAKDIEKLPLGELKRKYMKTVGEHIPDPKFREMFDQINEQRIFLMHKFFQVFPVTKLNRNEEAATRLKQIDKILADGRQIFSHAFEGALDRFKIPRRKFREFLAFVIDHRKKAKASE